ncbi:MAG: GGDEF domain-containing protein, partial [Planctomycetes bacterium]|nr:GGDEF domain-containing protein [Planctomycetota bacterium]
MSEDVAAGAVIAHVKKLLYSPRIPELTPELAAHPDLADIHHYIVELRHQLGGYTKGDFSSEIKLRGVVAGMVKSLQANMRHLIWQMERVESGDLTQRVDFMGDFSNAFNKMVVRLDNALAALRAKENELLQITNELEKEVEKRGAAMAALQKSEETFKYLAEHDPLTGLLNRRSFFTRAEMELTRSTIMDKPCSVALMDVDHFKRLNDTYGHLNGDIALRHIASQSEAVLRDGDIVGRYGGEEFVFFFAKANLDQGRQAAERIRRIIESTPLTLDGVEVPITASFGVTTIPAGVSANAQINVLEFAVGLADAALYRS